MNKTQINFLKDTANIYIQRNLRKTREYFLEPEPLTLQERVAQIMSGVAVFKADRFHEAKCPPIYKSEPSSVLKELFYFQGDDDYEIKKSKYDQIIDKLHTRLKRKTEKLLEDAVLGKDEKARNELRNVNDCCLLTEKERHTLSKICKISDESINFTEQA